jgi:hypothetical protein
MLPYRSAADDEDDYVVEGRDPEGEEGKNNFEDTTEDEVVDYNAEDTLLWWRGAPYVKSSSAEEVALDEEIEVINESSSIVEGTWRRMFEIDLREGLCRHLFILLIIMLFIIICYFYYLL